MHGGAGLGGTARWNQRFAEKESDPVWFIWHGNVCAVCSEFMQQLQGMLCAEVWHGDRGSCRGVTEAMGKKLILRAGYK